MDLILVVSKGNRTRRTHTHTHTHTHTQYIYIYIYIYMPCCVFKLSDRLINGSRQSLSLFLRPWGIQKNM